MSIPTPVSYTHLNESGEFKSYGHIAYRGEMSLDELMMGDTAESYQQEQGLSLIHISKTAFGPAGVVQW